MYGIWLAYGVQRYFQQYLSYILAISFTGGDIEIISNMTRDMNKKNVV
jgi:hypothetical protein